MRGRSDLPRLPRFSTETAPAAFRCKASASIYSVRAFQAGHRIRFEASPALTLQTCGPYLHLLASAFQSLLAPPLSHLPHRTPQSGNYYPSDGKIAAFSFAALGCLGQDHQMGGRLPSRLNWSSWTETTVRGKMAGYLGSVYSIGCCPFAQPSSNSW